MPAMYVANCTPQHRHFQYRLPERRQLLHVDIPPGEQRAVPGVQTRDEAVYVADQQEHFGMVAAADVNQSRNYIYTLWATDKPVSVAQMRLALDRNVALKTEEGDRTRRAVAVGVSEVVQNEHRNSYASVRVAMKDARRDTDLDLNEIHTHRKDGNYGRGNDFDVPLVATKSRRRKVA